MTPNIIDKSASKYIYNYKHYQIIKWKENPNEWKIEANDDKSMIVDIKFEIKHLLRKTKIEINFLSCQVEEET